MGKPVSPGGPFDGYEFFQGSQSLGSSELQLSVVPKPLRTGIWIQAGSKNILLGTLPGRSHSAFAFVIQKNTTFFLPISDLSWVRLRGSSNNSPVSWIAV